MHMLQGQQPTVLLMTTTLGSTVAAVRNNSCIEQNIVDCALKEVLLHTSIFTCNVCHTGWMLIQPNGWMVELGRAQ